jgi:hypothetical protein
LFLVSDRFLGRRVQMKRLVSAFLISGLLITLGCGDDDGIWGPPPGDTSNYYPMAVGSYWEYEASGVEIYTTPDTLDMTGTMTRTVAADTITVDSIPVFEMHVRWTTIYVSRMTGDTVNVARFADTLYICDTDTLVTMYYGLGESVPDTLLVLPGEVGASWLSRAGGLRTSTVTSLSEAVDVPEGSYDDCMALDEISETSPENLWQYWYADGVGDVKEFEHLQGQNWFHDLTYSLVTRIHPPR